MMLSTQHLSARDVNGLPDRPPPTPGMFSAVGVTQDVDGKLKKKRGLTEPELIARHSSAVQIVNIL